MAASPAVSLTRVSYPISWRFGVDMGSTGEIVVDGTYLVGPNEIHDHGNVAKLPTVNSELQFSVQKLT